MFKQILYLIVPRRKMLQRRALGSEKLWTQICFGMLFRWKWSPKWENRMEFWKSVTCHIKNLMEFWEEKTSNWSPKWENRIEFWKHKMLKCQSGRQNGKIGPYLDEYCVGLWASYQRLFVPQHQSVIFHWTPGSFIWHLVDQMSEGEFAGGWIDYLDELMTWMNRWFG